ncbi:MAG TPA: hypothetical protein PK340_00250 [Bacilli bacterium]|jgi:hypothetical protein|nr:hypothetical protein [Bacilli bacterium]
MEEKKTTKYFIRIIKSTDEYDLEDIESLIEENPELKKLGITLLFSKKKMLH